MSLIQTLEQLRRLRQRTVEEMSSKLASHQQLCQRYAQNVQTLSDLAADISTLTASHAALMINQSSYKRNIQHVIDWQKQEQALATLEAQKLQKTLLHEAKREKRLELSMAVYRQQRQIGQQRREQKTTDAVATQSWLRQKAQQKR